MAASTPNKVLVSKGGSDCVDEAQASEALTPGELLAKNSSGKLIPHGTADGAALPMFCVQNPYNDGTGHGLDHDYATDETAYYIVPRRGDIVYVFIKASEALTKHTTYLASDGAGALQGITMDATAIDTAAVAIAEETVTIGGSRARAKVRIL